MTTHSGNITAKKPQYKYTVMWKGQPILLYDLCKQEGLEDAYIRTYRRISSFGWDVERALTTPLIFKLKISGRIYVLINNKKCFKRRYVSISQRRDIINEWKKIFTSLEIIIKPD